MSPSSDAATDPADALEARLVWMMGSPRTGSTWLLRMLIHPWRLTDSPTGMAAPPVGRGPDVVAVNESFAPQRLVALGSPPFEGAAERDPEEFLLHTAQSASPSYWLSEHYADVWQPAVRGLLLERLRAQCESATAAHRLERPLVVIKEPNGSQGALLIRSLLPASRLLFLLRDGRDVVDSMLAASSPDGWRAQRPGATAVTTREQRLEFIRGQAELWLIRTRLVRRAWAATPPEQRYMVRYERLLADPRAELTSLCAWLGLRRSPRQLRGAVAANRFGSLRNRILRRRRGARAASPGLWRENLTDEEQEVMHEVLADELTEQGYELDS